MKSVPWLTSDRCLSRFSAHLRVARRSYAAFVLEGVGQGRRDDLYKARALGRIRGVIGLLVQEMGDASLTAVAERFGRDLSSISRNVAAMRRLIKEDQVFRQRYMEAKNYAISQA